MPNSFSPVLLFTYNRLFQTKLTVESLQRNEHADRHSLFVFSDGPKENDRSGLVDQVRQYLHNIQGFREIRIVEREKNLGLAGNIIDGVSRIVDEFGRVIVIEDDLILSPFFLRYMNDGLHLYEHDDRIISIHGYVYPVSSALPETFFLKGADCWGWATWKRGWELFEKDGSLLLAELRRQGRTREFDFGGSAEYTKMLEDQNAGKNNSWAIRWHASAFLRNKLTLYPGRSLVKNIGLDGSGTHCKMDYTLGENVTHAPVSVAAIPAEENKEAWKAFSNFFNKRRGSWISRIGRKIRSFLCR